MSDGTKTTDPENAVMLKKKSKKEKTVTEEQIHQSKKSLQATKELFVKNNKSAKKGAVMKIAAFKK